MILSLGAKDYAIISSTVVPLLMELEPTLLVRNVFVRALTYY